jgi:hypothetical protein
MATVASLGRLSHLPSHLKRVLILVMWAGDGTGTPSKGF